MPSAPKGKTRLKKLVVDEVSLVDRGANGKRILLSKRVDTMTDTAADAATATETVSETPAEVETVTKAAAEAAQAEAVAKAVTEAVAKAVEQAKAEAEATAAVAVAKALEEKAALEKRLADAAEAAEVAESIQKAAKAFPNVPAKADVLGPDLRKIRKADGALADRIESLLKAFDAASAQLLQPTGASQAAEVSDTAWDEIQKRANDVVKAGGAKTLPEAITKVCETDPDLYARYSRERNSR